jgi:hypothetical protein
MKKAIFRIFNVLMAVVVLLSSTGFGLIEHSCTVKGKQTSLHKTGSVCCGNAKQQQENHKKAEIKKAKCCSEDEKYENVEYSSSISQLVTKFAQTTFDWVKTTVFNFAKNLVELILKKVSVAHHPSSISSSGREILVFIQSFLI